MSLIGAYATLPVSSSFVPLFQTRVLELFFFSFDPSPTIDIITSSPALCWRANTHTQHFFFKWQFLSLFEQCAMNKETNAEHFIFFFDYVVKFKLSERKRKIFPPLFLPNFGSLFILIRSSAVLYISHCFAFLIFTHHFAINALF